MFMRLLLLMILSMMMRAMTLMLMNNEFGTIEDAIVDRLYS